MISIEELREAEQNCDSEYSPCLYVHNLLHDLIIEREIESDRTADLKRLYAKLHTQAIQFLVLCPTMNVSDRNFFELVACLSLLSEEGSIGDKEIGEARSQARKEVEEIRNKEGL